MTIKEQIKDLDNELKPLCVTKKTAHLRCYNYFVKRDRANKKFIIMKENVIKNKVEELSQPLNFEETKKMIAGMKKLKFFFL
jgi:hypothetical protein|nr:MAG TPA: hypothetical protein [Caudoviricetes sp.]